VASGVDRGSSLRERRLEGGEENRRADLEAILKKELGCYKISQHGRKKSKRGRQKGEEITIRCKLKGSTGKEKRGREKEKTGKNPQKNVFF